MSGDEKNNLIFCKILCFASRDHAHTTSDLPPQIFGVSTSTGRQTPQEMLAIKDFCCIQGKSINMLPTKKKSNQMIDFLRRPPKKEKEKEKNGNRKGPFSILLNSD